MVHEQVDSTSELGAHVQHCMQADDEPVLADYNHKPVYVK